MIVHSILTWMYPELISIIAGLIPTNSALYLLLGTLPRSAGPWFNIKMSSYQYRKSHCGDKTVVRSSYLHNGISYAGKMSSLYWIGALATQNSKSISLLSMMIYPRCVCPPPVPCISAISAAVGAGGMGQQDLQWRNKKNAASNLDHLRGPGPRLFTCWDHKYCQQTGLNFAAQGPILNTSSLTQIKACCLLSFKPLSEPMMF